MHGPRIKDPDVDHQGLAHNFPTFNQHLHLLPFLLTTTTLKMSFTAGQKVYFDLDSDFSEQLDPNREPPPPTATTAFVGDIKERDSTGAPPPPAPSFTKSTTGFPAHKKRTNRVSAFKQQRAAGNGIDSISFTSKPKVAPQLGSRPPISDDDRMRIDQENKQRLAEMSPQEIEREREELFQGLPAGLIQKLLARANLDSGSNERDLGLDPSPATGEKHDENKTEPERSTKKVSFATPGPETTTSENTKPSKQETNQPSGAPVRASADIPDTQLTREVSENSIPIHFPAPPQPPDLDPNSDTFLTDLHQKYFPNLPYDPSSVSWMQPVDSSDTRSPYHPTNQALSPTELRFNFRGELLAPSKAREIPVTEGLHHHAEAPEAAGYTIPELVILARSAVPTQRCVAYQTLGRILYRLGKGEFGVEEGKQDVDGPVRIAKVPDQREDEEVVEESVGSVICTGLWNCIEGGKVIEILTEEANKERGHLSARTYAQEALWNWRRGGGRKRKAV